jgi:two-component system phosphate regulon sensor histidine kinase PhoR
MSAQRPTGIIVPAVIGGAALLLTAAWLAEPWLGLPQLLVRIAVAVALLVGGPLAFALTRRQMRAETAVVQQWLQSLPTVVGNDYGSGELTAPEVSPMWQSATTSVQDAVTALIARSDHGAQARQGAEVRARRLSAELEQLHEVLASLSEPLLVVNRYGEIALANDACQRLFQFPWSNAERPRLEEVIKHKPLVDLLDDARRRRSLTQRSQELTITDPEGRSLTFRVSCRGLAAGSDQRPEQDGAPAHGALAVLTDITVQKVIQKRNAEFVSAVSHDMKTPLSSIKAYVELLADGEAEDENTKEEFLGVINSQTNRLQRLIDNLLNLARIEAGVVGVNKEARSLNAILQEALEVMRPAAEKKQQTLVAELSPLYLNVLADRDTMLQAAINLIGNAVKYTRDGGRITLRSRLTDDRAVFEVEDTGVGLSAEDCQKVFEKFYRVKKDREMAGGTGLGLPLVKHIVEDVHGGRVELRSTPGVGSTFSVSLPMERQLAN